MYLEIIEHGPVQSTDRLEKPRRQQSATAVDSTAGPADVPVASATLPRRWGGSNRIVVHNKGEFKLRRNGSLADVPTAAAAVMKHSPPAMVGNGSVYQPTDELRRLQVPAHIVKSIVVSVLQQQGITDPSPHILDAAIQEYYAKNPQGVSFTRSGFFMESFG